MENGEIDDEYYLNSLVRGILGPNIGGVAHLQLRMDLFVILTNGRHCQVHHHCVTREMDAEDIRIALLPMERFLSTGLPNQVIRMTAIELCHYAINCTHHHF